MDGETYYPAVNVGYSGTARLRGSKIGGMANDNVRGMPTFATMYVTQEGTRLTGQLETTPLPGAFSTGEGGSGR